MELQTISQISKALHLSTRTLRYYEQLGLIESQKKEGYAYRVYSEDTVRRLQQIVILRKLRIPLKQIVEILKSDDAAALVDAFQKNLLEINQEITALSTLRQIISTFLLRLHESTGRPIHSALLEDAQLLETLDAVNIEHIPLKNEKNAADLQTASEHLNRLIDRDVRIVYLPPMTLASIHITGQDNQGNHAEAITSQLLDNFIRHSHLKTVYPAARHFGFNNPDGVPDDDPAHGYERCISIPEDMEVTAPFVKKRLPGGLYAAHVIAEGAWDEGWLPLHAWVSESDRFDFRWESVAGVCGWLEEHLNYWDWQEIWPGKVNQIDLLLPIQPKFARSTRHPQEQIVDTLNYNGVPVEVVSWTETLWCGKLGYANQATGELDVDPISQAFLAQDHSAIVQRLEPHFNALLNLHHISSNKPLGAMFAFQTGTLEQPAGFDTFRVPAGQYMRLALDTFDEATANALGCEPWRGGPPPFAWIGERIAPQFGYRYADDTLPIFEYYGLRNDQVTDVISAWLYVPVEKIEIR